MEPLVIALAAYLSASTVLINRVFGRWFGGTKGSDLEMLKPQEICVGLGYFQHCYANF